MTGSWKYAHDVLAYPQIQRPGPLSLIAEGEALENDRLLALAETLRDQFFPQRAIKESVALHGQARGVPRHKHENDAQYRLRVINAYAWQALAGRHHGMYKIFAEYGFPIIDMQYLKANRWAEFDIEVQSPPGQGLDFETFELIEWLVFEYKRASAMLRKMRLVKVVPGKVNILAAAFVSEKVILYPPPPTFAVPQSGPRILAASILHETITLKPAVPRKFKQFSGGLKTKAKVRT